MKKSLKFTLYFLIISIWGIIALIVIPARLIPYEAKIECKVRGGNYGFGGSGSSTEKECVIPTSDFDIKCNGSINDKCEGYCVAVMEKCDYNDCLGKCSKFKSLVLYRPLSGYISWLYSSVGA